MARVIILLLVFFQISCAKDPIVEKKASKKFNKTVIIGSSISSGVGASSYELSWAGLLKAANVEDTFINFSRPGYATFHYLPTGTQNVPIRPDTTVNISKVIQLKPTVVIISLTTNDISNGYSPATYMANLKVITDALELSLIKYFITSTTLRNDYTVSQRDSAFSICKLLRQNYEAKNRYVEIMSTIADTIKLKIDSSRYANDYIHPNDLGHNLLSKKIQSKYLQYK